MAVQTYTFTRTQALVDQVDLFMKNAGISESGRRPVADAVGKRWITALGVYVKNRNDHRVLEGELEISWTAHSDHPEITVSTDLPGWKDGAVPELSVLASRLATYANDKGFRSGFWVRFTPRIRNDATLYRACCAEVGVGGSPPKWAKTPSVQRIPVQDFSEAHAVLRNAT